MMSPDGLLMMMTSPDGMPTKYSRFPLTKLVNMPVRCNGVNKLLNMEYIGNENINVMFYPFMILVIYNIS
jgi:hypothetical protein